MSKRRDRTILETHALEHAPFLFAIATECDFQCDTWGHETEADVDHSAADYGLILAEEYGEVVRELYSWNFHGSHPSTLANLRSELAQLAAVGARIWERTFVVEGEEVDAAGMLQEWERELVDRVARRIRQTKALLMSEQEEAIATPTCRAAAVDILVDLGFLPDGWQWGDK